MKFLLAFCVFVVPSTYGIYQGTTGNVASFPYAGSMGQVSGGNFIGFCGANLIGDQWALVGASCLDFLGMNTAFYFGTQDLSKPVVQVGVLDAWAHPDFNATTFTHDIALVRLSRKVNLVKNKQVQTICLSKARNVNNLPVTSVGYGVFNCQNQLRNSLDKVEGRAVEKCDNNAAKVCATFPNNGQPVSGDAGSGLVTKIGGKNVLLGVATNIVMDDSQQGCPRAGSSARYTRVSSELDFIKKHVPAVCVV